MQPKRQTGRRGYGIEIDHHYVDIAIGDRQSVRPKGNPLESKLSFDDLRNDKLRGTPPWLNQKGTVSDSLRASRGIPPKQTRFRKGVSGNPKGRPKGSKNLSTYLLEAARDQVSATVGGKVRKITKIQATAMQLATKAAGGDQAAINQFLDWMDEIESRAAAARPSQFPLSEPDVEVLRAVYERMKQCKIEKDTK